VTSVACGLTDDFLHGWDMKFDQNMELEWETHQTIFLDNTGYTNIEL
jgi:hypothetical protein